MLQALNRIEMNIFYNQCENFNHVESFFKNHDFFGSG